MKFFGYSIFVGEPDQVYIFKNAGVPFNCRESPVVNNKSDLPGAMEAKGYGLFNFGHGLSYGSAER